MSGDAGGLLGATELTGAVVGVHYRDGVTGFGVVEVDVEAGDADQRGGARCAGPLSALVEGQRVRLVGSWGEHPRYGPTFEVAFYEQVTPRTVAGLKAFLGSDRFQDLGDRVVTRVLAAFGAGAGDVIEHEPDRLVEEAGLSRRAADDLHARWMEGRALAALVALLEPADVPMAVVRAVHGAFGAEAVDVARQDPYALLEVDRCRFSHADALGRHVGVEPLDERRLSAGALAAVRQARRRQGHEYLTRRQAVEAAARMLGVHDGAAEAGLEAALAAGDLVQDAVVGPEGDGAAVYTSAARETEQTLADDVVRLLGATSRLPADVSATAPAQELTPGQAAAVRTALTEPVTVLTGGPGTGKTRTIAEVVRAGEEAGLTMGLCAPTGRAAKRVEELVGRPATTVHRLLEARPRRGGGFVFGYGPGQHLPLDLVVCDEASMCDSALASQLVGAVDDGAHLLLVGDADQLPPVGPGDVLRDLLACGVVPTTVLTEVHRQAAGSRIVSLAREVNRGEVGPLSGNDREQVFLAEEPRRHRIVPRVVEAVANRAPDYLGVSVDDIQVLAPVYGGPVGVDALNESLKAALNPAGDEPGIAGLQAGDRVMQTRNDAELEVSNGDVGSVVDVDRGAGGLRVAFPRGEVTYGPDRVSDLTHAWAVTVHKSQGGEWPVVVLVLDRSHRGMLWRNLVYTAVTRATRALILVGQEATLRAAVARDRPRERQTGLTARIAASVAQRPSG